MDESKTLQFHKDHLDWLHDLNFFQDEIKFFQNKLIYLILNKFQVMNMETAQEYRNIFMKKLREIDQLRHDIIEHELLLSKNQETEDRHQALKARVEKLESQILELRKTFKSFASHHI